MKCLLEGGLEVVSDVFTDILAVRPLCPLGHDTVAGAGLLALTLRLWSLLGEESAI